MVNNVKKVGKSRPQTIQSGRRRVIHWRIGREFGLEILFINVLENGWFNYISDKKKGSKNKTKYIFDKQMAQK